MKTVFKVYFCSKNLPIRNNEYFQPIPIQHVQSSSNQSARERLFGQQQQHNHQQNLAAAAAAADLAEHLNINKKVALVKPELRENCERLNIY